MAVEKVVNLDVNVDDSGLVKLNEGLELSQDSTKALIDALEGVTNELKSMGEQGEDATEKIDEGSKEASKSVGGIGKAFRAVGTAIKAAGIGLVIAAFAQIKELLEQNQAVLDFFNTTFNATSIAFNDFVNFISNNWEEGTEAVTDFFEPENLKATGEAIATGIVDRFKQLIEATKILSSAFTALFKGEFSEAADLAKDGFVELFDVVTGEDGGLEAIKNTFTEVTEAVTDYVSETVDAAQAQTELTKRAEIARVVNQGLIEQNDRLAEQQRQIRDDTSKSIEERIAANEKLAEILDQQEEDLLANAQLEVDRARQEVNRIDNQENRIALIEAENELLAIQAQVEGFRSEQETNRVALINERIELENSEEEAVNARRIAEQEFQAERIEDEEERLNAKIESLALEEQLETERLERQIELFKEGTQARIDAEQELLDFEQDVTQRRIELDDELAAVQKTNADEKQKQDELLAEQELTLASDTIGTVVDLLDENSKVGKAAGIAQATINTWQGVTQVLKNETTLPEPFGTIGKIASTAAVLATGFNAVRQIAQTPIPSGGGGGFGGGGGSAPAPIQPNFNVVGQGGANQIAEVLSDQPPVKAFVVGKEVSTQQELDRNIAKTATFG